MKITIIICLSLIIIVGIICFTVYKMRNLKKIETDLFDIRHDIKDIKIDLDIYNRILEELSTKKDNQNE